MNELRDWFEAARHYAQATAGASPATERNLKLEALAAILDGGQRVVILADAERDIEAAVEFAEEEGLDMILAGGRDAWKVKDLLAEKNIPVILGLTQSLPAEDDDPYDRPFRTAGELAAAGVKIAFASGAGGGFGPGGPHQSRTTPYEAAMAVAYGLDPETALLGADPQPGRDLRRRRPPGHHRAGQDRQPDRHRRRPARDHHPDRPPDHQRRAGVAGEPAPRSLRALPGALTAGCAPLHLAHGPRDLGSRSKTSTPWSTSRPSPPTDASTTR